MNAILSPLTNSRLWVAAFLIAAFGSASLWKSGIVPGWPGVALFAAAFLFLIPLVRSTEHGREACGASTAMKAYNRRMIFASLSYVALLLAGVATARYYAPPAAVRVLLAIAAAAPVFGMIGAMALLLKEEKDEYQRMRIVQQTLVATGFLLAAATLYGFLNVFDLAPRLDAYLVVPVWAVGLGFGGLYNRLALGDGRC